MVGKIKAAVDTRRDSDFVVMARTDARAVHGFNAAIDRAHAYAEAGADILFVEACETDNEIRALPRQLPQRPLLMNMVIGGKTPIVPANELTELGYGLVLYANAALQGALLSLQRALAALKETRQLTEASGLVASFKERQGPTFGLGSDHVGTVRVKVPVTSGASAPSTPCQTVPSPLLTTS